MSAVGSRAISGASRWLAAQAAGPLAGLVNASPNATTILHNCDFPRCLPRRLMRITASCIMVFPYGPSMNLWTRRLHALLRLRFKTANGSRLQHFFFGGGSSRREVLHPV